MPGSWGPRATAEGGSLGLSLSGRDWKKGKGEGSGSVIWGRKEGGGGLIRTATLSFHSSCAL